MVDMELFIQSNNTDEYRDGAWVVIARMHSKLCPVSMVQDYIHLTGVGYNPEKHFTKGLLVTKSSSISYTRARELVLKKLQVLDWDTKVYTVFYLMGHRLQLMLVSLTAGSNATVGRTARMPRKVMSGTHFKAGFWLLRVLVSDHDVIVTCSGLRCVYTHWAIYQLPSLCISAI